MNRSNSFSRTRCCASLSCQAPLQNNVIEPCCNNNKSVYMCNQQQAMLYQYQLQQQLQQLQAKNPAVVDQLSAVFDHDDEQFIRMQQLELLNKVCATNQHQQQVLFPTMTCHNQAMLFNGQNSAFYRTANTSNTPLLDTVSGSNHSYYCYNNNTNTTTTSIIDDAVYIYIVATGIDHKLTEQYPGQVNLYNASCDQQPAYCYTCPYDYYSNQQQQNQQQQQQQQQQFFHHFPSQQQQPQPLPQPHNQQQQYFQNPIPQQQFQPSFYNHQITSMVNNYCQRFPSKYVKIVLIELGNMHVLTDSLLNALSIVQDLANKSCTSTARQGNTFTKMMTTNTSQSMGNCGNLYLLFMPWQIQCPVRNELVEQKFRQIMNDTRILTFAPAGNDFQNLDDQIVYPACIPHTAEEMCVVGRIDYTGNQIKSNYSLYKAIVNVYVQSMNESTTMITSRVIELVVAKYLSMQGKDKSNARAEITRNCLQADKPKDCHFNILTFDDFCSALEEQEEPMSSTDDCEEFDE